MESKRPCCSSTTCSGMAMEKGCMVFAIINAIIVSISTIACLGFLGMILRIYLDPAERGAQGTSSQLWFFTILCVVCCVGTAIAFVFAVLLCVGLAKKRPRLVMAYLVYGIITEVLSVLGTLSFIKMEWGEFNLVGFATIFLGICVVYSFLLLLVYQTYVVISDIPPTARHTKLVNYDDC